MKKLDWILIIGTILFSILFYQQSHGINYLIFTVFLGVALFLHDETLIKNKAWLAAAAFSLISAIALVYQGTGLALGATITSLSLLSALSISKNSSAIAGIFYSIYSSISAIGFMFVDLFTRREKKNEGSEKPRKSIRWIHVLGGIGIVFIVVIFFVLYQKSNPLFKDLTEKINLDFINWPWIRFSFFGFILLYGFFYHRNIKAVYEWDINQKNYLEKDKCQNNSIFGRITNVNTELKIAFILIVLLNILLATVNLLDVFYLWGGGGLPEGMTYSDFVHQGTANLIISVILAIIIVVFFFRHKINFIEKAKTFKTLAIIWMLQNLFVSISTVFRNQLYISEYTLTYKRLGVYIWLAIVIFGLISTIIKVYKKKTNWFLVRANSWSLICILVVLSLFNWDVIITKYNIKHSSNLDYEYLLEMDDATLPYLLELSVTDKTVSTPYNNNYSSDAYFYDSPTFTHEVHKYTYEFLEKWDKSSWQSWNYSKQKTANKILEMIEGGELDTLLLSYLNIEELLIGPLLSNLNYIDLSHNEMSGFTSLQSLENIEYLDLSSNSFYSLEGFPSLLKLSTLVLDNNYINDLKELNSATSLQNLRIAYCGKVDLSSLGICQQIKSLDISGNEIEDFSILSSFEQLKELNISSQGNQDFSSLPEMAAIESLIFQNNIGAEYAEVLSKFQHSNSLVKLDISLNSVYSLHVLTDYYLNQESALEITNTKEGDDEEDLTAFFPLLKELTASDAEIGQISALKYYSKLEYLDLSINNISETKVLEFLPNLKKLILNDNAIWETSSFAKMKKLEHLVIHHNQITNFEYIAKLSTLKHLDLSYNSVASIKDISKLQALTELNLAFNSVIDISEIKNLKSLEVLYLNDNIIEDYSALYELTQLEELHINHSSKEEEKNLEKHLPNTKITYYGYRY
jgi:Leucine-rich repeat (LRR) protein